MYLMKKLTPTFLAGLLVIASVLFATGTVSRAQKEASADAQRPLPVIAGPFVTSVLAGRVLESDHTTPISGAWVDCIGPVGPGGTGGTKGYVTGSDGAYRFNLSQSGRYIIQLHSETTSSSTSSQEFYVIVPGADLSR
jgi:hypothetical protein